MQPEERIRLLMRVLELDITSQTSTALTLSVARTKELESHAHISPPCLGLCVTVRSMDFDERISEKEEAPE